MTPRRIELVEFQTTPGISLTPEERDGVRTLHPGLRVEPAFGRDGSYDLTPDEHIGVLATPTLVVEVRPKIPMASVLFMVSYSCGAVSWLREQPPIAETSTLVELLAWMLARLTEHATRRGLLTGYRLEEEALLAPRGRIRFDELIRRRLGVAPPIDVRHDVFTTDILENQLLLAAINAMARLPFADSGTRRELGRARLLLGGVTPFPRSATVPDVVITRLNRHYDSALALAILILRALSLDLGAGSTRAAAFLVDMNGVFETFVRRALREALRASGAEFPDRPPHSALDERGVVPLKPDLALVRGNRIVWVGDAKYKRLPPGAYKNADLYQLFAYSTALKLDGGTLIYAADKGVSHAEHVVLQSGKRLRVEALDLASPPRAILTQIERLASNIRAQLAGAHPIDRYHRGLPSIAR